MVKDSDHAAPRERLAGRERIPGMENGLEQLARRRPPYLSGHL